MNGFPLGLVLTQRQKATRKGLYWMNVEKVVE